MNKINLDYMGKFYYSLVVKAGLNVIPVIGGALASLLGDIQSNRNEKRLKEFLNDFADKMTERQNLIQKEFINDQEFLDVFINVVDSAMKQRKSEKRILMRNLLINSITFPNSTYDMTEEFERLLEDLCIEHIQILNVFYQDRENMMKSPSSDIKRIETEINKLNIDFTLKYASDYLDYINDLENINLIYGYVNNYHCQNGGVLFMGDSPYITTKGETLIKYITD